MTRARDCIGFAAPHAVRRHCPARRVVSRSRALDLAVDMLRQARGHDAIVLDEPLPVDRVPTPALVVDLDALERNIASMAAAVAASGLTLRPHGKMHKCPEIARRQVAAGAVGICAAKPAEAEVFVAAGLHSVLLTSPVVRPDSLERLVALQDRADVCLVVDSQLGVDCLADVARAHGTVFPVCLDLDPDMGRTGVARDERGLALAAAIADRPQLALRGVQQYCGNLMHINDHQERRERVNAEARCALAFVERLTAMGIPVDVRTGGGTGSFDLESGAGLLTELQAGSYVVMDREYGELGFAAGRLFDRFEPALFIHATAISAAAGGTHVTVDAGIKAMATDTVRPAVHRPEGLDYRFAGDEHGVVMPARETPRGVNRPASLPALGTRVELLAPHCDPTINLHDFLLIRQGEAIVEIWPVAARGAGW